jgi:predicted Zn-dependent protease
MPSQTLTRAAGRLAVAALAFVTVTCATNPVTGRPQLSLISESDEIALGKQASQEVEQTIGLVEDADLQAYVRRIGLAMATTSQRPSLPWTFGVVDDPTPNAFALPGGFIYITRGMATLMSSEAELASVLGHEIGHVTAKHSVASISQQQLAQLGLGVGSILVPRLQQFQGLVGTGLGLLFLQHGRDAERQADDLGFQYASARGYAMSEMANVFRSLERLPGSGRSALPSFLSTHPSPAERVKTIEQKAAAQPTGSRGSIVREAEYLRQVDGLVYGEDPRQGFFRDSQFLHPDLRFQFSFPRGWTGQNMKQAVLGTSQRQDAALQLTLVRGAPEAAAREFGEKPGIALAQASRDDVNGLPAVMAHFEAQTDSGVLAGIGGWISHGGRTYQLLTYTSAQGLGAQDRTFQQIIQSFGPLRDQSALNVQPKRLDIVTVQERQTLSEFNRRMPSAVTIEELAVINELAGPSAVLAQGSLAKRVVGPAAAPQLSAGRR